MTTTGSDSNPDVLDLGHKRAARAEGRGTPKELRYEGKLIAELPPELPIDVFSPIREVNVDWTYLLRHALDLAGLSENQQPTKALSMLVDMLVVNPSLPEEVLQAIAAMAQNLFGEDGYHELLALRPSGQDIREIVAALGEWYGVSLGESESSSTQQTDGERSRATSSDSTESTLDAVSTLPGTQILSDSDEPPA